METINMTKYKKTFKLCVLFGYLMFTTQVLIAFATNSFTLNLFTLINCSVFVVVPAIWIYLPIKRLDNFCAFRITTTKKLFKFYSVSAFIFFILSYFFLIDAIFVTPVSYRNIVPAITLFCSSLILSSALELLKHMTE